MRIRLVCSAIFMFTAIFGGFISKCMLLTSHPLSFVVVMAASILVGLMSIMFAQEDGFERDK